jgi:hypothetical protein
MTKKDAVVEIHRGEAILNTSFQVSAMDGGENGSSRYSQGSDLVNALFWTRGEMGIL